MVLAGFFLAGYVGLSVPVLGRGILGQFTDPQVALRAFGGGIAASARSRPGSVRRGSAQPLPAT